MEAKIILSNGKEFELNDKELVVLVSMTSVYAQVYTEESTESITSFVSAMEYAYDKETLKIGHICKEITQLMLKEEEHENTE